MQIDVKIAAAMARVGAKVRQLRKDDENRHGGYMFVSVDKFYEAVGPLMAEEGLFCFSHQAQSEIWQDARDKSQLTVAYDIYIGHAEAENMIGPIRREVTVQALGPQAYASAESFAMKYFLRSTFKVPTGDKDDADAQEPEPVSKPNATRGKPTKREASAQADKNAIDRAVLEFVGEVNALLDDPLNDADALFAFATSQQNAKRMGRIEAGEFDHLPEVAALRKRMADVYAKAMEG